MEQDWMLGQGNMLVESAAGADVDNKTAARMNIYNKKLGNQTLISGKESSSQGENAQSQIFGTNRNGSGNHTTPNSALDGSQHSTQENYKAARQGKSSGEMSSRK